MTEDMVQDRQIALAALGRFFSVGCNMCSPSAYGLHLRQLHAEQHFQH